MESSPGLRVLVDGDIAAIFYQIDGLLKSVAGLSSTEL
jgi:hypothetical protein